MYSLSYIYVHVVSVQLTYFYSFRAVDTEYSCPSSALLVLFTNGSLQTHASGNIVHSLSTVSQSTYRRVR
jgi:hypothetical protein